MDKIIDKLKALGTIQVYPPKSLIYMEQDESREVFVLLDGDVRCYRYDVKGNMITLPFQHKYDLLGELPANDEFLNYQESCESENVCQMLRIDSARMCQNAVVDIEIANFLIQKLSKRSRMLAQFGCIATASSLSEKVALFIYEHEEHFCSQAINKTASMLNVPPESLSRILKKFRNENILDNRNGTYRVVDMESLRVYFDFAYCGG